MKKQEIYKAISKELTTISEDCFLNTLISRDVFEEKAYRILDLYLYQILPSPPLKALSEEIEIDFDGNVLTTILLTNGKLEVVGAMNGYGNGISRDKIKIKYLNPVPEVKEKGENNA